jgi:NAD(P)-dependent dehydrogenase (short-subunit alcohol dehydrogenase family)
VAKDIDLTGKTAVITGAGSGIGAATARLLARHGAKVHVADINAEAAPAVAREIGCGAADHAVDVSRAEEVEALAKAVFDDDGCVDILHNNAGIGHGGDIRARRSGRHHRLLCVQSPHRRVDPRAAPHDHPITCVLGDQTYESLARRGETMTTAAMATYAYDQIDQARTELNSVSK